MKYSICFYSRLVAVLLVLGMGAGFSDHAFVNAATGKKKAAMKKGAMRKGKSAGKKRKRAIAMKKRKGKKAGQLASARNVAINNLQSSIHAVSDPATKNVLASVVNVLQLQEQELIRLKKVKAVKAPGKGRAMKKETKQQPQAGVAQSQAGITSPETVTETTTNYSYDDLAYEEEDVLPEYTDITSEALSESDSDSAATTELSSEEVEIYMDEEGNYFTLDSATGEYIQVDPSELSLE